MATKPTTTHTPAFDPTKPVQTRDGRKARIICTDRKLAENCGDWPIVALVIANNGSESPYYYRPGGQGDHVERPYDLINVPEEHWVNIYRDGSSGKLSTGRDIYASKELADVNRRAVGYRTGVAAVKIEIPAEEE